jgi:hypothetical protein
MLRRNDHRKAEVREMTPEQALFLIRQHGVVLASAKGPVPRMAEAIAGEPIKGSWWAHPKSHEIFAVFEQIGDSPDVLVCRLVNGKVTFVHRRLWPALIRAAGRFPPETLAKTRQEHTSAGHHVRRDTPFPEWADEMSLARAAALTEDEALDALGAWTRTKGPRAPSPPRR